MTALDLVDRVAKNMNRFNEGTIAMNLDFRKSVEFLASETLKTSQFTLRDFCREEAILEKSYATASKLGSSTRNSETQQDVKFQCEYEEYNEME